MSEERQEPAGLWIDANLGAGSLPPELVAWPSWFRSFVLLGNRIRSIPEELPIDKKLTVYLAVPNSRLVGAAIAFGLVGSTGKVARSRYEELDGEQAKALRVGEFVRVIEGPSASERRGNLAATAFGGIVSGVSLRTRGTEILIDTRSWDGAQTKRYVLGHGSTRFQRSLNPIGASRAEVGTFSNALEPWVKPADYLDFMLDSSHELTWVGSRARIEDSDLKVGIARGPQAAEQSVQLSRFIRPRGDTLGCAGWRTVIHSSRTDPAELPRESTSSRVMLLDGNSAIARHLSVSGSNVTVCVLDASDRGKQIAAMQAIADKRRWANPGHLDTIRWVAPAGSQVAISTEGC